MAKFLRSAAAAKPGDAAAGAAATPGAAPKPGEAAAPAAPAEGTPPCRVGPSQIQIH